MFKDDYKVCNDNIKADPALVENIVKKNKHRKLFRKRSFLQRAACVAAAVLIIFSSLTLVYDSVLKSGFVTGLDSYNEIYVLIKAMSSQRFIDELKDYPIYLWLGQNQEVGLKDGSYTAPGSSDNYGGIDYSDTNLQVAGVQEADVVKTDGRYIYAISNEYVYIVAVDGEDLSILSQINIDTTKTTVNELYVTEKRLVIIKSKAKKTPTDYIISYDTEADIYDISDRTNPKYMNTLGQNGSVVSSRMIDDVLYLVTNHYIIMPEGKLKQSDPSTYVPSLYDGDKATVVNPGDICIVPEPNVYNYLIATGIDTSLPEKHASVKAIFGSGSTMYSNTENMYVASTSYSNTTNIFKFSLNKGKIEVEGTASVPGMLLNQFSMDEYNGYFRVCTTSTVFEKAIRNNISFNTERTANNLYILNDKMEIVGKLEGLAKNESIYSVRFDGDIGYFVTFRRTDPLFAVDLSNPESPEILSELKIPGFSNYLHVYKENLLFGLGMDADPDTGRMQGIKLSMFDVTDKRNVTEKHVLRLGEKYNYSSASYNHKAILVAPERSLIGFASEATREYMVFSYDEETGFKQEAAIDLGDLTAHYPYYSPGNIRGFYINDYLYIYTIHRIEVFSMDTFEHLNTLILATGH